MRVHSAPTHSSEERMEMTPMIDVTFLILIFFMCTLRFRSLESKLAAYLPHNEGLNDVRDNAPEPISIVMWAKVIPTTGDRVLAYRVGPRICGSLDAVEARIAHLHAADPERVLALDPRDGVLQGDVVALLDRALGVGFEQLRFVGHRE